jgi:hypothetical protein
MVERTGEDTLWHMAADHLMQFTHWISEASLRLGGRAPPAVLLLTAPGTG